MAASARRSDHLGHENAGPPLRSDAALPFPTSPNPRHATLPASRRRSPRIARPAFAAYVKIVEFRLGELSLRDRREGSLPCWLTRKSRARPWSSLPKTPRIAADGQVGTGGKVRSGDGRPVRFSFLIGRRRKSSPASIARPKREQVGRRRRPMDWWSRHACRRPQAKSGRSPISSRFRPGREAGMCRAASPQRHGPGEKFCSLPATSAPVARARSHAVWMVMCSDLRGGAWRFDGRILGSAITGIPSSLSGFSLRHSRRGKDRGRNSREAGGAGWPDWSP